MNDLIKHINAIRNIPVQEDAIKYKLICELIDREGSQFEEKTGEWIKLDGCDTVQCSECFNDFDYADISYLCHGQELPDYCPNCGADMRKVE